MTSVPFVPGGETLISLPVAEGEAVHAVTIGADLEAVLRIPIPPLTQLTHHPERTEYRTETVSMWRPGTSRTVSETVSVTHDNGTTTQHVVTATPVNTRRDGPPGRDAHHRPPGAREGRGG